MKTGKIFLSAVLAGALTLTTACGATPSPSDATVSGGAPEEKVALSNISFMTKDYYAVPEIGQKLSELFEADTGTALEIVQIPSNNWEEKVTASFVSGDMPDVVRLPENPYAFVKQDFLLPLDEYIEANPAIKALLEANPEVTKPFQYFGKTYAISINNQKFMTMWMRDDWLKATGLAMPTTMDELLEVLRAFRDMDLDGNGKNDTIPLTLPTVLQTQDMFASYFGTRNEVYIKDGKAVVPYRTEEYKEYLAFIKMMYDEKLLDQEMPTNTSFGSVRTKFNTGLAGSVIMWDDSYSSLTDGLKKSGFEDARAVYVPAFKSEKGAFGLSYFQADSPIGLTAACKNPQEVFNTFFNWYFTTENGIISTTMGIPNYNFDVVDGVAIPNVDNGGIGFRGQSMPPIDRNFEYPFKFNEVTDAKYKNIVALATSGDNLGELVRTTFPASDKIEFTGIADDLKAKVTELFHNYVIGNIDYDQYLAAFEAYAKEINLDTIVEAIA
ncbi:MAG: extracellular solute-binding protein [Ruthenibacterium sp.]